VAASGIDQPGRTEARLFVGHGHAVMSFLAVPGVSSASSRCSRLTVWTRARVNRLRPGPGRGRSPVRSTGRPAVLGGAGRRRSCPARRRCRDRCSDAGSA
jgi:hypothetical protein